MNNAILHAEEKTVSVIVPAYNCDKYVAAALESIFNQTYKKLEVIVINDGSTDNTRSVLEKFGDRIVLIDQKNSGPATARNRGLEKATGSYVAFLDGDDLWEPNKLAEQIAVLEKNPDVALVYSNLEHFYEGTDKRIKGPSVLPSGFVLDKLLVESFIALPTVVVRAEVIKEIGGFDESLYTAEDLNLYLKIARDHKFIGVDKVFLRRRLHGNNTSERTNIKRGTLDNLDKIVALYPSLAPSKHEPMRQAYVRRGKSMMKEYFKHERYAECQEIIRSLANRDALDIELRVFYFYAKFKQFLVKFMRRQTAA